MVKDDEDLKDMLGSLGPKPKQVLKKPLAKGKQPPAHTQTGTNICC